MRCAGVAAGVFLPAGQAVSTALLESDNRPASARRHPARAQGVRPYSGCTNGGGGRVFGLRILRGGLGSNQLIPITEDLPARWRTVRAYRPWPTRRSVDPYTPGTQSILTGDVCEVTHPPYHAARQNRLPTSTRDRLRALRLRAASRTRVLCKDTTFGASRALCTCKAPELVYPTQTRVPATAPTPTPPTPSVRATCARAGVNLVGCPSGRGTMTGADRSTLELPAKRRRGLEPRTAGPITDHLRPARTLVP
ncbi:Hypothetical protein ACGLYG10_0942 [Actinomyces glycerinitolerans]|uniref:Uncharacterized protein n=1 Tax=Actinomyces glycerinitolerans TaxID=1892869 RepID=A0A1M4RXN0_9ACTO|nr:Hypothetical protein ACGLYG10_0942 [Actinomyces glycerinitolerans]